MSDTDDTDELLLIPPDVYVSNPVFDTVSPYYDVVDCLISQVNHLESRINFIETSSELSIMEASRYSSKNDLFSAQSTPEKPRSKLVLNSLPNSPNTNRLFSKEVSHKSHEIDNFLSNVKIVKRLSAVRNLEHDFSDESRRKLNSDEINEMLKKVEIADRRCGFRVGDNVPDSSNNYTNESFASEKSQMTAVEQSKSVKNAPFSDHFSLGLVSLGQLWNSSDKSEIPSNAFQQIIQEERLRREHCESTIQDLQQKILELQERVAVAIQVDEAKDSAILRLHESWEKINAALQDTEQRKTVIQQQFEQLNKKLLENAEDTNLKSEHYEKEISLAINLAHSSQNKLVNLERHNEQLQEKLKAAELQLEEYQKKALDEINKNQQFHEILAQKELEINENNAILGEARMEISQSRKAVELSQSEILLMKNENNSLQLKLDKEKENNKKLCEQKNKLLDELRSQKSMTKSLQEELNKSRDQMESNKLELKNFYQGQVELVVQNKLKEFQMQLDNAEKALKTELSKREFSIAKIAASHIQQITEKHSQEIKLLEEKHQEENRLYQVQSTQLKQELEETNVKIKRQHEKHIQIEKQLHNFMESLRQDVTTIDEINSFRSKSFNNLEEILAFSPGDEEKNRKVNESAQNKEDTPVTSRIDKWTKRREGTIQDTIQMLLQKRDSQLEDGKFNNETDNCHLYKLTKDMRGKPPWK